VLRAVLDSLYTDPQLGSLRELVGLAFSLRHITSSGIVFTQLPIEPDPLDPDNRVVIGAGAQAIWDQIRLDMPPGWTPESPSSAGSAGSGGSASPPSPSPSPPGGAGVPSPSPDPSPSLRPGVCPNY
jgi:hypothetical protein